MKRKKEKVNKKLGKKEGKEEREEDRNLERVDEIVVVAILVLVVTLSFLFLDTVITGQSVTSIQYVCKDSDGKNFYREGEVELYNAMYETFLEKVYHDYCSSETNVVEYYCEWESSNYVVKTQEHLCEFGCQDSACSKPRLARQDILTIFYENLKSIFGK